MSDASAWVPYVALATSAVSLGVSVLSYRAGGPRLSLEVDFPPRGPGSDPFPGGSTMRLTVVNAGRAAVTVQSFKVTPYGERLPVVTVDNVSGPSLPHRLEAHAMEVWDVDALPAARAYYGKVRSGAVRPNSSWPTKFRFTVTAGNGKRAHSKVYFDAMQVIAESQQP